MKVIKLHYPKTITETLEPSATAIGFFDGLHLGHVNVIDTMLKIASENSLKKAVITFDPHPSVVLNPNKQRTTYITPLDVKIDMLKDMGVDYCFVIQFSSAFQSIEADTFVKNYIIDNNIKSVITGFDFTYGKFGKGNTETLDEYHEFTTTVVPKFALDGFKVSTTDILYDLKHNQIEKVNKALGRPFEMEGIVVQGAKLGRTIGFPTANIEVKYRYHIPGNGVYSVTMDIHSLNKTLKGVCNIGVKPTVERDKPVRTIEVHLLDFSESIYGEEVTVHFHHFIRDEQKFDGLDALKTQINKDILTAKELLEEV